METNLPIFSEVSERVSPRTAMDVAHSDSIVDFLKALTVSQWFVLIYPAFLFAVHRKRETDDVAGIDRSAIFQIGFLGLCALQVMHRLSIDSTSISRLLLRTPLKWLMLYGVLAVISTAWSEMPALTLFRGSQILVFLLLIVDGLESFAGEEELLKFQLCFAAVVGMSWQYTNLMDGFSMGAMHTSAVPGTMLGASIAGYLVLGRQWQWLWAAVVLTVILGTSAAAYVCALLGLGVAMMTLRGRHGIIGLMTVGLFILILVQFPGTMVHMVFYNKADNQILSGTGRVPVWNWLIRNYVSQRPILGYGFGYGEVQARLFNEGNGALKMTHMHNAVMSALLNLGGVGVCLLAGFWAGIIRAMSRIQSEPARAVLIAAVIATLLDSLTMESITAPLSYGFIGHLLVYATVIHKGTLDSATMQNDDAGSVEVLVDRP